MLWTLLRRHLRPYLPHVAAVIVLQLATILATLYLPSLNADIIDNGVATGDTDYIWRVGGLMLAVAMVQVVTAIASVWFGARVSMGMGRDIRRSIYTRVDRFSTEEMGRYGAPTLITRATNDVQQVQMLAADVAELHGRWCRSCPSAGSSWRSGRTRGCPGWCGSRCRS